MAQQKRDEVPTLIEVLKLVDALSSDDRYQLLQQLKLEDLRREIDIGLEESERGETVSEEEMRSLLDAQREEWLSEKGKKE